MKPKLLACLVPLAVALSGCSGMSTTDKGLLAGGGLGAALGTGIGAASGNALAGGLIGTGLGAAVGGLVGNDIERQDRRDAQNAAAIAATQRPQLPLHQVVYLAQQHTGDDLILRQIETTNSTYNLTAEDIVYLRQQGVSERVIGFMQARRPVAVAPVQPVRHVYVVEPPPPAVSVGFGYSYGPRHRRCW